jgi:peptide subunit release factor 1 (eRF1)
MIIIEKDNKMVTIFKASQIDVEDSSMIRVPKKQKKGGGNRGKEGKNN